MHFTQSRCMLLEVSWSEQRLSYYLVYLWSNFQNIVHCQCHRASFPLHGVDDFRKNQNTWHCSSCVRYESVQCKLTLSLELPSHERSVVLRAVRVRVLSLSRDLAIVHVAGVSNVVVELLHSPLAMHLPLAEAPLVHEVVAG